MSRQSAIRSSPQWELNCYIGTTFFWLRWIIVATLLLLAIIRPVAGYGGLPIWVLILLFASYNLLIQLFQQRLIERRAVAWVALLDLPVTALLYFCGAALNGPLFVLFLLITFCAATCLSVRGSVLYTGLTALVVLLIAPVLPLWSPGADGVIQVGVQLIVIALIGVGTAILMRHVRQEHARARSGWQQAERLEELDRLRTRFVSTISHDLRTPLTAIRAATGMLIPIAHARLSAEEQELLESTVRNAKRLGMLIDDLLALNQIETHGLRLEREALDLRAVVTQALSTLHPLIQEKGQSIVLDLPEPLLCDGDLKYLEHVVVNVLANANQHTPTGTRIAISGQRTAQEVCVTVGDNGPGIPVEALDAIFQPFQRRDSADGRSGLGLAIAKHIVELHGGRIWAESRPGGGASFHVALPRLIAGDTP